MKASIRAAWVIAVALLAYAVPASAVDFGGYFRDSWGVNSKGGGQACYKVVGGDYKLRLGNECDNYGEWGLSQNLYKGKDGVEMSVGVMVDYDQLNGFPTGSGNPGFQVQQNWVKMKFPQLNGATFWAGKQYYERENIDMIDFFYLNMSDTGIGFEDMDTGFGKLSFSIFGVNMARHLRRPGQHRRHHPPRDPPPGHPGLDGRHPRVRRQPGLHLPEHQ